MQDEQKLAEYRQLSEDLTLMTLYLHAFEQHFKGSPPILMAWKGHSWDALDALDAKDYINAEKNRNKRLTFMPEGVERAKMLFKEFLGKEL